MEIVIIILIIFIGLPVLRLFIVEFIIPVYFTKKQNLTIKKSKKDLKKVHLTRNVKKKNIRETKPKIDSYKKFYYENGQLEMEGKINEGKGYGLWKYYFENGQLKREGTIGINELEEGLWKSYYENGQLKSEGNWKDGKEVGLWKPFV